MEVMVFQITSIILLFFTLHPLWQVCLCKELSHVNVAPTHAVMRAVRCTTLGTIHLGQCPWNSIRQNSGRILFNDVHATLLNLSLCMRAVSMEINVLCLWLAGSRNEGWELMRLSRQVWAYNPQIIVIDLSIRLFWRISLTHFFPLPFNYSLWLSLQNLVLSTHITANSMVKLKWRLSIVEWLLMGFPWQRSTF